MNEPNRGYDLPYLAKRQKQAVYVVFYLILAALVVWMENRKMIHEDYDAATRQGMLILFTVIFVLGFLEMLFQLLAKVHFVPQGIALTLFGVTLRRIPTEKIQVLSAVTYSRKGHTKEYIAVCMMSMEEINCATAEDLHNYLKVTAGSLRVSLNLYRHIFWLEWSPDRLKLLRMMYPNVPWMDGSPDKRFEQQLQ